MSGHGTIEAAVKSTKIGAYDFIEKPLSIEKVTIAIGRALEASRLEQENLILKSGERYLLIGESDTMKRLKEEIKSAASSIGTVLIIGENGAGKHVSAWSIHNLSERTDKPFIAVNCAAIPDELIEGELFGYEKGAFTGATSRKKGRFEMANEGTIFLDGIADMPLKVQDKVLRILQEKVFERVGGAKGIKTDARVIASTNKDLENEAEGGRFRNELLSALDASSILVPPLRERAEDVPLLVEHFISEFSRESGKPLKKVSQEAMKLLKRYIWPGNVRELRNLIERLVMMASTQLIEPKDLPPYVTEGPREDAFSIHGIKEAMHVFEKEFIIRKLEENGWSASKTAAAIGMEKGQLQKKIKSYGIQVGE